MNEMTVSPFANPQNVHWAYSGELAASRAPVFVVYVDAYALSH